MARCTTRSTAGQNMGAQRTLECVVRRRMPYHIEDVPCSAMLCKTEMPRTSRKKCVTMGGHPLRCRSAPRMRVHVSRSWYAHPYRTRMRRIAWGRAREPRVYKRTWHSTVRFCVDTRTQTPGGLRTIAARRRRRPSCHPLVSTRQGPEGGPGACMHIDLAARLSAE